ncbi:MAG TPA: zf-HC2 domain-containing protein [Chloroflexota bacterium]|nr:zf-HC2 domain-containing protein [Chloroflexota bacterium]
MNDNLSAERLPHVHEMLSEYLDGQLDEATRQRVEAHLVTCADCRADYETLRQTVRVLRQLPMRAVPRGFAITASAPPRRGALFWLRVTNSALAALFIALLAARLVLPGLGQTITTRSDVSTVRPAAVNVASPAAPGGQSSVAQRPVGLAPVSPNQTASTASEAASAVSHASAAPTAAPAPAQPFAAAGARSSAAAAPTVAPAAAPTSIQVVPPIAVPAAAPVQRAPTATGPPSAPAAAPAAAGAAWPAWYDPLLGAVGAVVLAMLGVLIVMGRHR